MNLNYFGQDFIEKDRNENVNQSENQNIEAAKGFSRDLSRIIFSASYRRLAGKTQIFPIDLKDHLITRLTHTTYVTNIALDIAQRLNSNNKKGKNFNLNLDLISAIGHGHDIGHTPFGHAGEKVIRDILAKEKIDQSILPYYFKHNIFSVHILQNIDKVKDSKIGYDLSWQVIDGILKHTEIIESAIYSEYYKNVCNNRNFTKNTMKETILNIYEPLEELKDDKNIYYHYPYPLTLEGQIVKLADEISQYYHDILDWVRVFGVEKVQHDFFEKILKNKDIYKGAKHQEHLGKFINTFSEKGELVKERINEDNFEFFQNELKELFINEVVCKIVNLDPNLYVVPVGDKTKIVKNTMFELIKKEKNKTENEIEYKVIPKFTDSINEIAKIIVEKRNELLNHPKIKGSDDVGKTKIKTLSDIFLKEKKLFDKYCLKTLKRNLAFYSKYDQISQITNIDFFDLIENEEVYVSNQIEKEIGINHERFKLISIISVLEYIAGMTDKFIDVMIKVDSN